MSLCSRPAERPWSPDAQRVLGAMSARAGKRQYLALEDVLTKHICLTPLFLQKMMRPPEG